MNLRRDDFAKVIAEERLLEGRKVTQKKREKEKHKKNSIGKSAFWLSLAFLVTLVCMPFVVSFLSFLAGGFLLAAGVSYFEKGDFDRSYKSAYSAENAFSFSESIVSDPRLTMLFSPIVLPSVFSTSKQGSGILMHSSKALNQLEKVFEGKATYPKDEFVSAISELKSVLLLSEQLPSAIQSLLPVMGKQKTTSIVGQYTPLLEVMPDIFGLSEKKKYLVLFQNNMELRPTGGFIGSYGLLTLQNGKIEDFTVNNVYDADGQLKGHVEPPYSMRRYLPTVHWYLRDSNYSPDFTTTASNSAYFLREETGEEVDGVFGLDLSFVKNILKATGPVYLTEYRRTITADNMYEIVQKEAQENSFAGSNQKKDILKSLLDALMLKLDDRKNISISVLAKALLVSIDQKHVLFAFSDPAIENAFLVSGFSSSFWDPRVKKENALYDFLAVNETNLGVNKANYFITRDISYNISFAQNTAAVGKVTIRLNHSGQKGDSKNDYKTYLRIFVPDGTTISDVFLDGQRQSLTPAITDPKLYEKQGFRPKPGLEIEIGKDLGKTFFGFPAIIATGADMKIEVTYKLPFRLLSNQENALYSLLYIKQAGTDSYPFSFTGEFSGFRTSKGGEKLTVKQELLKDIVIDVPLVKE